LDTIGRAAPVGIDALAILLPPNNSLKLTRRAAPPGVLESPAGRA
jgi:hypothetical protein